ncbi:type-F conjugative transfer system mating-pair stabilization protein TraN, partial [Escherichia coli]
MKRLLPLLLGLAVSVAQADSNSDYRAGSDFARQIQGQGTGSIQGFKPQESIPGYNANPDETKYYGGVTAGGDGGLKNDGTTEWATGETGKTITESFMNKPKDILSPDAPFIQTGRDVVNRADSIVGNTGQQCSAQEISRSEYTNYTCERDTMVEEYCTRTAAMTGHYENTTEIKQIVIESSAIQFTENNNSFSGEFKVSTRGKVIAASAVYSWNKRLAFSNPSWFMKVITPFGLISMNDSKGSVTLSSGLDITDGQSLLFSITNRHNKPTVSSIWYSSNMRYRFTITLTIQVPSRKWVPDVIWTESCPFSKELGKLTKTECTEAGGNRTLVKDGQSYSMYQSCWAYRDTYVTQSADKGTCQTYTDNPACTLVSHQCAFYSEEGACLHEYATYSCESRTSGKVMVCGGDVFCLDGECDKAQSGKSNDFAEAVSQLAALAAAGKDVAALNGVDVRAFTGEAKFCRKAAAGFSNCCKDGGWGQDVGLAKCNSEEKALGKAKDNKLTVSVGEFCSKKVLGVCLQKKR